MAPYCGRLGTEMTATGAGHTVERFCVRHYSSSQCPGGGPPYPQAYARNTGNWETGGCPDFVPGNNTAGKCVGAAS
jgi:hypothetical protein